MKAVLNETTGRLELKAKDSSVIAEIYTKENKAYVIGGKSYSTVLEEEV